MSEYSLGRFDMQIELSSRLDEIDACSMGINMLGEELKATTISRNYFNNIFNSVSDMIFVLDEGGRINDTNRATIEQLGFKKEALIGKPIDCMVGTGRQPIFSGLRKGLKRGMGLVAVDTFFKTTIRAGIAVHVSASHLTSDTNRKAGILVTARNMTAKLERENAILRAVINTEEKERHRLAKDLHDSLGQQLSTIKFYISTTAGTIEDKNQKTILVKANKALAEAQEDMRNLCFNLMPKTLELFGLLRAVRELCRQATQIENISFRVDNSRGFPELEKSIEIDIFRIVQEFINNAVTHGGANNIIVRFRHTATRVNVLLKDNGRGFEVSKATGRGMGLQNAGSRVKSHNGKLQITSKRGIGTTFTVWIPLI